MRGQGPGHVITLDPSEARISKCAHRKVIISIDACREERELLINLMQLLLPTSGAEQKHKHTFYFTFVCVTNGPESPCQTARDICSMRNQICS